jgi:hypothetical protein
MKRRKRAVSQERAVAAKKRRQERSTGSLGFNAALPPDECSTVIKGPPIQ